MRYSKKVKFSKRYLSTIGLNPLVRPSSEENEQQLDVLTVIQDQLRGQPEAVRGFLHVF